MVRVDDGVGGAAHGPCCVLHRSMRHVKRAACCTVCVECCAVHGVRCMVHVAWCTLHSVCFVVHVAQCAFYVARCAQRVAPPCVLYCAATAPGLLLGLGHGALVPRGPLAQVRLRRDRPLRPCRGGTQNNTIPIPHWRTKQTNTHAKREDQPHRRARPGERTDGAPEPRARTCSTFARAHGTAPRRCSACESPPPPLRACADVQRALPHGRRAGAVVAAAVGGGSSGRGDRCSGDANERTQSPPRGEHARDLSGSALGDLGGFFCALAARPAQHKQTNRTRPDRPTRQCARPRADRQSGAAPQWRVGRATRPVAADVRACVRG